MRTLATDLREASEALEKEWAAIDRLGAFEPETLFPALARFARVSKAARVAAESLELLPYVIPEIGR